MSGLNRTWAVVMLIASARAATMRCCFFVSFGSDLLLSPALLLRHLRLCFCVSLDLLLCQLRLWSPVPSACSFGSASSSASTVVFCSFESASPAVGILSFLCSEFTEGGVSLPSSSCVTFTAAHVFAMFHFGISLSPALTTSVYAGVSSLDVGTCGQIVNYAVLLRL